MTIHRSDRPVSELDLEGVELNQVARDVHTPALRLAVSIHLGSANRAKVPIAPLEAPNISRPDVAGIPPHVTAMS